MVTYKEMVNQEPLTQKQTKNILAKTKAQLIFVDVMNQVEGLLEEDEILIGKLPLSASSNSGVLNVGWLGATHVQSKRGKEYVNTFNDLRGNRLLVFTNRRMIFLVMIEFLEENLYYSYPYEEVKGITIRPLFSEKKQKTVNDGYYFDFEAQGHLLSETIGEKDKAQFLAIREEIPALKNIPITNKIIRKHLVDKLFSNFSLPIFGMKVINILLILLFVVIVIGVLFGIGPFDVFFFKNFK